MRRLANPRAQAPGLSPASEWLLWAERLLGFTPTGLLTIGGALVGFGVGRAASNRLILLVVYGVVLLVVAAKLLGLRPLSVEVSRSRLPSRIRVGQPVEVDLSLRAKRRLSTVVIEESLPAPLGMPVRLPVPLLPSGAAVDHSYRLRPVLRGVYKVGPLVAEWSDPFGITRRRKLLAEAAEVIVHPATEAVHDRVMSREWEDPPIRPPISKPWPTGFEFYGMRDYVEGDDPRRIVWRATARSFDFDTGEGRILVRESEQGITDRVNLILDTDRESHSPGHPSQTFELAVRTVASLGLKHLKDGFAVNFDINSKRVGGGYRGARAELPFLDAAAAVDTERAAFTLSLDRLVVDPNRSAHNVLVTPHLDQQTAVRLRLLRGRGTSMLLAVILSEDTDPATLHRAGGIGCSVVEVTDGAPLDRLFSAVVGGLRR